MLFEGLLLKETFSQTNHFVLTYILLSHLEQNVLTIVFFLPPSYVGYRYYQVIKRLFLSGNKGYFQSKTQNLMIDLIRKRYASKHFDFI